MLCLLAACNGHGQTAQLADATALVKGDTISSLPSSVLAIYQDKKLRYWLASDTSGVFCVSGRTIVRYTNQHGLCGMRIREIQEDKKGNLYFTTEAGISQWNGQSFTTLVPITSTTSDENWALHTDDLWFGQGTTNNGPMRFDGQHLYALEFPKSDREDAYYALYPNNAWSPYSIYTIYKDLSGHLWFGTADMGLCRYDGVRAAWMFEDDLTTTPEGGSFGIHSILQAPKGDFWICHTGSTFEVDVPIAGTSSFAKLQYIRQPGIAGYEAGKQLYIMSMLYDNKGQLWMATYDDGLWKYNGERMVEIPCPKGSTLFKIYQDRQERILLGSHQGGLLEVVDTTILPFNP